MICRTAKNGVQTQLTVKAKTIILHTCLLLFGFLCITTRGEEATPTRCLAARSGSECKTRAIAGWAVHVSCVLLATNAVATSLAIELLASQLEQISRVVPSAAVAELRKVPLWLSPEYPGIVPRAEYHPSADWLREHGRDPSMAKGVEFTNVRIFESETKRMPVFVLHELAHAYHSRFLPNGFDNPEIKAAYEKSKAGGRYEKVDRRDAQGRVSTGRAYALTNPQEYFAETTEAFYGTNDFFPFNREQLRQTDPVGYALMEITWCVSPNFVVILGEGHGWSSTSVQMDEAVADSKSAFVRTPNLERLAREGMRFADFYAPSPRCTPSRATLFTGKSPAQLHMTFVGEGKKEGGGNPNGRVIAPVAVMELPTEETTIAEELKRAGYTTAHFGKWHVGRADPSRYGFDESDGPTNNGGPDNVDNPHPKQLYGMTERGVDFMARQVKAGKPFYLQLSHYASRQGGGASSEALAVVKGWGGSLSEREIVEAAADLDLDIAFGRVLNKLDELGIANNTYVIFTTDHGTPGKNPPFAGGKGTVSEGGLRVPFIMRGPGIKPGLCSHVRASGQDVFSTLAELAHVSEPLPKGLEGGSLVPVLIQAGSGTVKRPCEEFIVHFPHYDKDAIGPASAILLGDFKLIHAYESGALSLFNIAKDPGERCDLAADMPDRVKELAARLTEYLATMHAQMPLPNPAYDATKSVERRGEGKRKARP